MSKLFKVINHGKPIFCDSKQTAKAVRDLARQGGENSVVMRGPDHWRGESFNVSSRTRSHQKAEW